ncbi:MAG TPA: hypothetical protein VIM96_08420 [Pseudomonadales bacterium]
MRKGPFTAETELPDRTMIRRKPDILVLAMAFLIMGISLTAAAQVLAG